MSKPYAIEVGVSIREWGCGRSMNREYVFEAKYLNDVHAPVKVKTRDTGWILDQLTAFVGTHGSHPSLVMLVAKHAGTLVREPETHKVTPHPKTAASWTKWQCW